MNATNAIQPVNPALARVGGPAATAHALEQRAAARSGGREAREHVGEFVANIFYATLMRQMEQSSLKSEYYHGGRGENVFRGQLHLELAKRIGRSVNDPVGNRLYESIQRHQLRGSRDGAEDGATPSARGTV